MGRAPGPPARPGTTGSPSRRGGSPATCRRRRRRLTGAAASAPPHRAPMSSVPPRNEHRAPGEGQAGSRSPCRLLSTQSDLPGCQLIGRGANAFLLLCVRVSGCPRTLYVGGHLRLVVSPPAYHGNATPTGDLASSILRSTFSWQVRNDDQTRVSMDSGHSNGRLFRS